MLSISDPPTVKYQSIIDNNNFNHDKTEPAINVTSSIKSNINLATVKNAENENVKDASNGDTSVNPGINNNGKGSSITSFDSVENSINISPPPLPPPPLSTPQKSTLNVTVSSLSSNSCSSSISTSSSASSSASNSSSTNSTQNISIADPFVKISETKNINEPVLLNNPLISTSPKSSSYLINNPILSSPSMKIQNRERPSNENENQSELIIDNQNESLNNQSESINNLNLMSVPNDHLTSNFKRGNPLGGSFRESNYKEKKENYLTEKKRITNDMLTIMREESIIVLADWLKIRGSLKNWIKVYVVLKPGIMLLYKSDKMKSGSWIGTIILNSCQLLERPSKKHGFCFKLFHPMEKSIWASKGPAGETYINVPYMLLPTFYLIFRASSETIGQIWMDAIELTLRSSHLLKVPTQNTLNGTYNNQLSQNSNDLNSSQSSNSTFIKLLTNTNEFLNESKNNLSFNTSQGNDKLSPNLGVNRISITKSMSSLNSNELNSKKCMLANQKDLEIEQKHFNEILSDQHDETIHSDSDGAKNSSDDVCSLNSSNNDEIFFENLDTINKDTSSNLGIEETKYLLSPCEEFGELGNKGQTEEVDEEGKGLIYCLVKQVRPGMDLSKVVLPTFILEPRSFLEKLTDFYYHSDILSESIANDDPYERMKSVIKFYLSGFYKKPKGLKKPYNPILGEVFRSYWYNPKTDSKTFYVAEQISHHPPITSLYVSNRKEGFCIYGTILARSKFYGNSVSAIMEGHLKLMLLNRGEEYLITMPYANCKGILLGKLTMELGGKINIECIKTGYSAEIEFKLKPLLGGTEASNLIDGKIKFAKETISTISGKWDGEIMLTEKRTEQKQFLLWNPMKPIIESRLKRYIVPLDRQKDFESELLWLKVSDAIKKSDQQLATDEKSIIENKQRESCNERKAKFIEYSPSLFTYDNETKEWIYNYSDLRPWDTQTDLFQYEQDFKIITKTKHNLSKLKNQSITSNPRMNSIALITHNNSRNSLTATVSNKSTKESSFDILMQYTEIIDRLNLIENNLEKITNKFDQSTPITANQNDTNLNDLNNKNVCIKRITTNSMPANKIQNKYSFNKAINSQNLIFNPINLLIALIAWLIGLLSAVISNKLLKII